MKIKFPERLPHGYKGEQGRILVVGGSKEYYGAPILTALGAEHSGADLITIYLPSQHVQAAKNYSLNFFIKPFKDENLSETDVNSIVENSLRQHVLVIGNGLGKKEDTHAALLKILKQIKIPTVIDAEGLLPEVLRIKDKEIILTPHAKEFVRVFGCEASKKNLIACAKKYKVTVLLKGPMDLIASSSGEFYENDTGCPEMRVGGTGDVLAGIVGSFISQGFSAFEACCSAAHYWGRCGSLLSRQRSCLTALDMISVFDLRVLCD